MNSSEFMLNNQVYTQKMKKEKKVSRKGRTKHNKKQHKKERELAEKQ